MYIKIWGARGSIPVSGKDYLQYGGDTTCVEIRAKSGDIIIIDAGTGIRRLGNRLTEENLHKYNFIFTHAHWDHLMGFPFFKPLYFSHSEFIMHKCPFHSNFVEAILSKVMTPPNFPVKYSDVKAKIIYSDACPSSFEIGSVVITPISLSHPNNGNGYKLTEEGKTFVFLTDNELGFIHRGGLGVKSYIEFSAGADLLIHDAEYTPEEYERYREWGHSSYSQALFLAFEAGVKKFGLFHHNPERSDSAINELVEICRQVAEEKKRNTFCFGVSADMTFNL
jgi:phosphoribosyl 1,2-cyclic phosphodiesterase